PVPPPNSSRKYATNMAFRVDTTPEAERDILRILDWLIAEETGQAGMRWFRGLEKAIVSLSEMPERCPLAPENESLPFEVRHLLYGRRPHRYRILFTVEHEVVYILHIWHGRRRHLGAAQLNPLSE
ncbi:MAG TPA: type II toxin-antitoxin system RelE/ParE family toxin, partial [Bryobacteraceae bacterium]|nr:type II toxin-antitoxin system RelE/ParE family toxin [Bryobacteraceae bacterium]